MIDEDQQKEEENPENALPLRKVLKSAEDDFLASCICISITKLVVK
jgi:hypothetical protein